MVDLYLDAEWYIHQSIFLIGYGFDVVEVGQLFGQKLHSKYILELMAPVSGYIYIYGPDIGMLEKSYEMDIRGTYRCINLHRVFRKVLPGRSSYKLKDLEDEFEIPRHEDKYKSTIFSIWNDWNNPIRRKKVLEYNLDDVRNLIILKELVFKQCNVTDDFLNTMIME